MDESEEELISLIGNSEITDRLRSGNLLTKRLMEHLSVQALLKEMTGENYEILHYSSGKPYIKDNLFFISISHTKKYIAIIIDREKETGIDIEQVNNKVFNVRSKFVSEKEEIFIDKGQELTHLLLYWSAKETLYKVLDVEGVNLKNDLQVQKFTPESTGYIIASESKTIRRHKYELAYMVERGFVLTWIQKML